MTADLTWKWNEYDQVLQVRKTVNSKIENDLLDETIPCRRIMGIPIVLAKAAVLLATGIGLIAEPLIKGIGNIFGSINSNQCSLLRGLAYVFVATPFKLLQVAAATPFFALMTAVELLVAPFWVAINPGGYKDFRISF